MKIWLASRFVDDHTERNPCDHPSEMVVEKGRRKVGRGEQVLIEGNEIQMRNLLGDALYYANPRTGPDELPAGLRVAAAKVAYEVRALLINEGITP